jgi:hypothetical protein
VNQIPSTLAVSTSRFWLPTIDLHQCTNNSRDGNVDHCECGDRKRNIRARIRDIPIKRWPRVESHSTNHTAHRIEFNIIRRYPGNPTESREGLPNEAREEEVDQHSDECDQEEFLSRSSVCSTEWSSDRFVGTGVEGFD